MTWNMPLTEHSWKEKVTNYSRYFEDIKVTVMSVQLYCMWMAYAMVIIYPILLWFLCASECLSLTWSEITIDENHVIIKWRQSKTDPFRRGQSIHIYSTNSYTCPVHTLKLFAIKTDTNASNSHVFFCWNFLTTYPFKANRKNKIPFCKSSSSIIRTCITTVVHNQYKAKKQLHKC